VRCRLTETAPRADNLSVLVAARKLSTIVGDYGAGSSIREWSRVATLEIDTMEADSERLPADIADSLAAHDLVVSRGRVGVNGAEQVVHGVDSDPCADSVLLPLVTLEGHAESRIGHR
jgi:hypothetical protein